MNYPSVTRPSSFTLGAVRRISALAIFAGASAFALHAQQQAPQIASHNKPSPQLVADLSTSVPSLATVAGVNYSSSSASVDTRVESIDAERLNLAVDPERWPATAAAPPLRPPALQRQLAQS